MFIIQRSMDQVSSLTTSYIIQLLQVYERVFRGESVNLFCYKGWSGGKQTRRKAEGPSAVQRKTWVIYSSVTTQRVNIKHSSSKSWRMAHSESSHFPILPLLHNTRMPRGQSHSLHLSIWRSFRTRSSPTKNEKFKLLFEFLVKSYHITFQMKLEKEKP